MRADMSRLIIEDGRHGHGGPATAYDKIRKVGEEYENLAWRESMSRHRKVNNNSQGDRLEPLRRYLQDNVGRPWNKVFAEICEHADLRTIRGYHLRQHVKHEVYTSGPKPNPEPYEAFLVDSYGILRKNPTSWWGPSWHRKRVQKEKEEPTKILIGEKRYDNINGVWYEVRWEKIEGLRIPGHFYSYGLGNHSYWRSSYVTDAKDVLVFKKQVGKKVLKVIREALAA